LWFDCTILEGINNGLLNLNWRTALCADAARKGNRDVALDIDRLIRDGDEVTRPHSSFCRDEKPARARFKNRYGNDVTNTKANIFWRSPVGKFANEARRCLRQNARNFRCNSNKAIGEGGRILRIEDIDARWAGARKHSAADERA